MIERTLVLIKPDGVQRGLVGRVVERFENVGLKIVGMKMVWIDKEFAKKHYYDVAERRGEAILKRNVDFLTLGPVVAIVLEGVGAIEIVRKLIGPTEPKAAPPGTIRGDFVHASYEYADKKETVVKNIVHASSSKKDSDYEIRLWFKEPELHSYKTVHEIHLL